MLSILQNFSDLKDLHKCANDLLHSPQIKQSLIQHQHEISSVGHIADASLEMLDQCGATRDILLMVKDHLHDLQHTVRRAKSDGPDFEAQISAHGLFRKKLKKELAKCLRSIKSSKNNIFTLDLSLIDQSLIIIVHVLREIRSTTILALESLLSLLSMPTTISIVHNQMSIRSKFRRNNCRKFLERCDSMEVRMKNKRLEEVEKAIWKVEIEIHGIVRRLIHTRVLLLNILNC
ncbi:hypothetical protein RND81_01G006200 [Saponaria officinalis]|uniref:Uncharacterized protein n=1 Tax=Saponaria officinalis TaxID=3572 RepID=A0AAW1NBG9_SAPOF